jgi:hypothetical protein
MRRPLLIAALAAALAGAYAPTAPAHVDLAGNARGDQVLLHQVLGQHNRPLFAGGRPAGGAFGALTPFTGPVNAFERAVAIDDAGGAVLAWVTREVPAVQTDDPPSGQVVVAIRQPQGDFGAPRQLAPDARYLRLVGNGRGDVLATWYPTDGPRQYSVRSAGGEFGPAQTFPASLIGVAIDGDGTVKGVFSESAAYPWRRLLQAERPPGGDFGPLREIPGAARASDEHLASAPDGRTLLVWSDDRSRIAADRPPGGDFGPPFEVQKLEPYAPTVDVKLSSSGAAAISSGTEGEQIAVRVPGGGFVRSTRVDAGRGGEPPNLAVDARGDVALAWHGSGDGVRAAYRDAATGSWSRPIAIAQPPGLIPPTYVPPGLALADSGQATVAWEESNGATVRTYTRAFQGSALGRVQLVDSTPAYFAESSPAACRPRGAPLLRRSARATVFVRPYFGFSEVFGCLLRRGAAVPLTDRPSGFAAHTMSLTGPLVAYGADDLDPTGTNTVIEVTDLRDPEFGISRGAIMESKGFPTTAVLLATRLRANGAVAWLSCQDYSEVRARTRECRRVGGDPKHLWVLASYAVEPRLVGHSRWIDRRTLKLRGSLLTWRDRGKLEHTWLR